MRTDRDPYPLHRARQHAADTAALAVRPVYAPTIATPADCAAMARAAMLAKLDADWQATLAAVRADADTRAEALRRAYADRRQPRGIVATLARWAVRGPAA